MITREDVAFYIAAVGGILGIAGILWKALLSRLMTKEDFLKELLSLKDWLNEHFVRKK